MSDIRCLGWPFFEDRHRALARLRFTHCRVPLSQRIGKASEGFKVAMRTLDAFRTSVAAAALGFARCALDEVLQRATTRKMFNGVLADFQPTQAKLAATERAQQVIDAAVQIWGGMGVQSDQPGARPYREIRALRIYEGASEVQQLITARELLKGVRVPSSKG